jgi:CRP-like cAMP-binding protein
VDLVRYKSAIVGNSPEGFPASGVEAAMLSPLQDERAMADRHPNRLLASLSQADFDLLQPHLKPIDLTHGDVLFSAGDTISRVFFPHSGVVSLVVALADGEMIEAAMVGSASIVGASAALDGKVALNTGIVQIAGNASTLDVDTLCRAAEQSTALRTILIRHEQAIFVQAQQSAACNASHTVEARLSRWLLWSRDLSRQETLGLTQEFVAQMLGVRRTSVSLVANTLQTAGLIRYRRGRIEVTNLEGLRETSCECYGRLKEQYDRLLAHDGTE